MSTYEGVGLFQAKRLEYAGHYGRGARMKPRKSPNFNHSLHSQGCSRSLQKWLHNNLISIVGICLGVGLLEVIWHHPHWRLAVRSIFK